MPSLAAPHPEPDSPTSTAALPRAVLVALALPMLVSSLGISIANVGLPTLVQVFGASIQSVQWVVLAYLLASTALVVIAGRLGDMAGRRRLLLAGAALFALGALAGGWSHTLGGLVAARAVQGVGAALMTSLAMALVGDSLPKSHAGRAMGLLGTVSALGTALGPTLGGVLVAGPGWRAMFLLQAPLALLGAWFAWRHLPADRVPPRTVVALPHGSGRAVARRVPLLPLGLLRDRALRAGLAANALVSTVMMATLVIGPFHLSRALGLPAALVGLALSAGPIVAALGGVPAGRAVDRFGAARVVVTGLAASAAGCLALALLPAALGVAGYVLPLMVVTAGYALFQAANNTAVMGQVAPGDRGLVSGLLNLSRQLGLIGGASFMAAFFAWVSQTGTVADATHATFGVAVLLVGGALAAVAPWRRRCNP